MGVLETIEKIEWFALGFIVGITAGLLIALFMLQPLLRAVFGW